MLFGLGGVFLLLAFGLFAGILLTKREDRERKSRIEDFTIDVIKDGIIPIKTRDIHGMSRQFYEDLEKYREYVHRRMSFGASLEIVFRFLH